MGAINLGAAAVQAAPVSAYARLLRRGNAAEVIHPFHVEPGDKVVLLCRVSSCQQGKSGNLLGQELHLRRAVELRGGVVVGVVKHEWSGRGPEWLGKLAAACNEARRLGATVLAVSTDRFIRSRYFKSTKRRQCQAQAQQHDLMDLALAANGVRLMTLLDPDAPPVVCRSLLVRCGQGSKGQKGGRPRKPDGTPGYRKRRREELLPRVLELRGQGESLGRIAKLTGLTKRLVQEWVGRN